MSEENSGIGMRQVKYIASCGTCPNCNSTSVKFKLPLECHLETKDKKLSKVVLDFRTPQYWLNTTVTTCADCGFQFHLREHNESFYQDLEKSKQDDGDNPNMWYYDFDTYKK